MGILQHIEHQISALNDLIKINNDRITGYEKGIEGTADQDLKVLFAKYIEQSKDYKTELTDHIHVLGGDPASGTTIAGKFYHTWIDVKARFTNKDRLSILSDCEYGEDVANAAYRKAMDDKELIWKRRKSGIPYLANSIKSCGQRMIILKNLRDAATPLVNIKLKKTEKLSG